MPVVLRWLRQNWLGLLSNFVLISCLIIDLPLNILGVHLGLVRSLRRCYGLPPPT